MFPVTIFTILFTVAIFQYNQATPLEATDQCLANGANCQPDGSIGNCCSGFCYRQVGWAMGDCRPRPRAEAFKAVEKLAPQCIADWTKCQPDGSIGYCCSGFCYREQGWAMGNCRPR